jgi:hypothetical protein
MNRRCYTSSIIGEDIDQRFKSRHAGRYVVLYTSASFAIERTKKSWNLMQSTKPSIYQSFVVHPGVGKVTMLQSQSEQCHRLRSESTVLPWTFETEKVPNVPKLVRTMERDEICKCQSSFEY